MKNRVEAVERALTILEAFEEPGQELSLAELSAFTGLYKSTILRLCGSLERFGYLHRRVDGKFRLGAGLWRLGSLYRKEYLSAAVVRPALTQLRELSGETASFYIRDGNHRICLYRLNANQPIRHHLEEGERLPLQNGAAGRLLLAHTEQDHPGAAEIREAGFTISLGERDPDIGAIAVPVFNQVGMIAGALTVSGLKERFDQELCDRCLPAMLQIADKMCEGPAARLTSDQP